MTNPIVDPVLVSTARPGPRASLTRPGPARHMDAPLTLDDRGRTTRADDDEHVRDLIRAVLFTEPGERPNRPDFGCALKTMVFLPNSDVLAAAIRVLVHGALQQWLPLEIVVEAVEVQAVDAELRIGIVYLRRTDGTRHQELLVHQPGGPS